VLTKKIIEYIICFILIFQDLYKHKIAAERKGLTEMK